jgi:hypothetical protein
MASRGGLRTPREATEVLRALTASPGFGIRLTRHARDRMDERNIGLQDVHECLETGSVVSVEAGHNPGQEKWKVQGVDCEQTLTVAIAVYRDGERELGILSVW